MSAPLDVPDSGTLRVQLGMPSAIDPGTAFEHDGALIAALLADPLVDCDPATGRLAPAAASDWQVAPDGLSVRFALRPDVRFHHGRRVTAEDYRYALSRVAAPGTDSAHAPLLSMIEGYEDVRAGRDERLSGVQALDALLLEVRLNAPFHDIAAVFSHRATTAVPAELAEADPKGFARHPVGNGPYRLDAPWEPGADVVLERFDGYYARNAAHATGGVGQAARVVFRTHPDLAEGYAAFLRGETDVTEVPPTLITGAAAEGGPSFRVTPNPMVTFLGFPTGVPPYDDPVVRRAVAMCVDREGIGRRHFGGTRPVAHRVLPPVLDPGGEPSDVIPYDPAGARRLLAEHGAAPPDRFAFRFPAGQGHEGWAADLASCVGAALGIPAEAVPVDRSVFLDELSSSNAPFRINWQVDFLSADNAIGPLLDGLPYGNPRVDDLLTAARGVTDPAARLSRYREAESVLLSDLPLLPLWEGALYHLVSPRVRVRGPWTNPFGEPVLSQYGV
ncbi:ABC transporter substrate-binding protein [Streptomyces sp. UNOC14_S4]|uniref:ABC transporter substrate-binding protein n=1 Tax=Streptomyces sp. UNOC14_S4 TaxID=2872340 RepID=UPI001E5BB348|nr:ABC transporter substrate-binding protein [Streptomyces sp. UNOC14_S4]MCC3771407.1 ABC transporter substrate-binding protein [Streptomyces sp. UNOC14_S4]